MLMKTEMGLEMREKRNFSYNEIHILFVVVVVLISFLLRA